MADWYGSAEESLGVMAAALGAKGGRGEYRVRCPVHSGKSDTSLQLSVSGGRIWATCHRGCHEDYAAFAAELERASGVRLSPGLSGGAGPRRPVAAAQVTAARELVRLAADNRSPTWTDFLEAKVWFPVGAKKQGWEGRINGIYSAYQQAASGRPVRAVREGGRHERGGSGRGVLLLPHMAYPEARRGVREGRWPGARAVAVSFAGDDDCPFPFALGALDLDYQPGGDVDGAGRAYRNGLLAWLLARGVPVFYSSSGNGFHALFGVDTAADYYRAGVAGGIQVKGISGSVLHLDYFPPGARHLLVLHLDRPAGDKPEPGGGFPVVGADLVRGFVPGAVLRNPWPPGVERCRVCSEGFYPAGGEGVCGGCAGERG